MSSVYRDATSRRVAAARGVVASMWLLGDDLRDAASVLVNPTKYTPRVFNGMSSGQLTRLLGGERSRSRRQFTAPASTRFARQGPNMTWPARTRVPEPPNTSAGARFRRSGRRGERHASPRVRWQRETEEATGVAKKGNTPLSAGSSSTVRGQWEGESSASNWGPSKGGASIQRTGAAVSSATAPVLRTRGKRGADEGTTNDDGNDDDEEDDDDDDDEYKARQAARWARERKAKTQALQAQKRALAKRRRERKAKERERETKRQAPMGQQKGQELKPAKLPQAAPAQRVASGGESDRQRQHAGASVIQARYRGRRDRNNVAERRRRDKGASQIQARFRGRKARRQAAAQKAQHRGASAIQARYRGRRGRKNVAERRRRDKGASQIQARFRGRKARRQAAAQKEQHRGASAIQARYRGRRDRKRFAEAKAQHAGASQIQARFRGRKARHQVAAQKAQHRGASIIQARFRGRRDRQRVNEKKQQPRHRHQQHRPLQPHHLHHTPHHHVDPSAAKASAAPETRLVAMADFAGEEETDISFTKGTALIGLVLEEGWWSGRREDAGPDGPVGDFPANHVAEEGKEGEWEEDLTDGEGADLSPWSSEDDYLSMDEEKEHDPDLASGYAQDGVGEVYEDFADFPLFAKLTEDLQDWIIGQKINGLDHMARALDDLGVADLEDMTHCDAEDVDYVCSILKSVDAKKFRRGFAAVRGGGGYYR